MHSQLPQLFVVLTVLPSVLVHLLAEIVEGIGIEGVWIGIGELATLFLGQFNQFRGNLSRNLTALAENHTPHRVVHHHEAALALFHCEEVHQGDVLHILAERCYQWGIAYARPYIFYFVEQFHEHIVGCQFFVAALLADIVDGTHDTAQVGHHRTHHATRQTASQQQG